MNTNTITSKVLNTSTGTVEQNSIHTNENTYESIALWNILQYIPLHYTMEWLHIGTCNWSVIIEVLQSASMASRKQKIVPVVDLIYIWTKVEQFLVNYDVRGSMKIYRGNIEVPSWYWHRTNLQHCSVLRVLSRIILFTWANSTPKKYPMHPYLPWWQSTWHSL